MIESTRTERAGVGDIVVVMGHRVGELARMGEILEILGERGNEHFRVRWDDGHESVYYPSNDAYVRPPRPKEEGR